MTHPPGTPQQCKWNQKREPVSENQPDWFDRHRVLSILLQLLAIPILGAGAFFLWIFGAEKYAISAGVGVVVLIVTMIITPGHNALGRASSAEPPLSSHPQTPEP